LTPRFFFFLWVILLLFFRSTDGPHPFFLLPWLALPQFFLHRDCSLFFLITRGRGWPTFFPSTWSNRGPPRFLSPMVSFPRVTLLTPSPFFSLRQGGSFFHLGRSARRWRTFPPDRGIGIFFVGTANFPPPFLFLGWPIPSSPSSTGARQPSSPDTRLYPLFFPGRLWGLPSPSPGRSFLAFPQQRNGGQLRSFARARLLLRRNNLGAPPPSLSSRCSFARVGLPDGGPP